MIEIAIYVVAALALIITIGVAAGSDCSIWKKAALFLPTAIAVAAAIIVVVPLAVAFIGVMTLSVFAPALLGLAALKYLVGW